MYYLDNIMHSRFCLAWVAKFLDPVIKLLLTFFFKPALEEKKKYFLFYLKNLFNKVLSKILIAHELAILIGVSRIINFIYS